MCVQQDIQEDILEALRVINHRYAEEEVQEKISNTHSRKLLKAMLDRLMLDRLSVLQKEGPEAVM